MRSAVWRLFGVADERVDAALLDAPMTFTDLDIIEDRNEHVSPRAPTPPGFGLAHFIFEG